MDDHDSYFPSEEALAAELKREQHRTKYRQVLKSTLFSLLVVAASAVLIAVLLLPVLQITGTSMTETLHDGDIVLAVKMKDFKTGDVIAFYYNNNILIKRVIAAEGDWVDVKPNGDVYVNNELLDEPYVTDKAFGECDVAMPYQVPEGTLFVMGDHRATSIDSRSSTVGCVGGDLLVGKLFLRVWPIKDFGGVQ